MPRAKEKLIWFEVFVEGFFSHQRPASEFDDAVKDAREHFARTEERVHVERSTYQGAKKISSKIVYLRSDGDAGMIAERDHETHEGLEPSRV